MNVEELYNLTKDELIQKLGEGPYLAQDAEGEIYLILDLELVKMYGTAAYTKVYAYGYNNKDSNENGDNKLYMPRDLLDIYHEKLAEQDLYIIILPNEDASFGDMDVIKYYLEYENDDFMVNGIPVYDFMVGELKKLINQGSNKGLK